MNWRITDPGHLLGAMRIALRQGGEYLVGRIDPNGPILRERCVSYIHKASWGMYAAGVDEGIIARLLDWAAREALRDNGDFYFPEEPVEYKDYQRAYRPVTFMKVAVWIGHPLASNQQVVDRLRQYYHEPTGGCFHYIGDDPQRPQLPETIGVLNTTFFGHFALAAGMRDEARGAGECVRRWVEANRPYMEQGLVYTQMNLDGKLITEVGPGERIAKVVDFERPKQEFWQVGTAMAYLATLYDAMRTEWGQPEEQCRPYLDAALELLAFESRMPLDTYLWPSKCKVGWGAGELLRVLVKHRPADKDNIELAFRVAERVAVFTFMDNQLPSGGWPHMHYPLADDIPELSYSYKPLKGTVRVPAYRAEKAKSIYLPAEEITGEFLGELKAIEQGVAEWLRSQ